MVCIHYLPILTKILKSGLLKFQIPSAISKLSYLHFSHPAFVPIKSGRIFFFFPLFQINLRLNKKKTTIQSYKHYPP